MGVLAPKARVRYGISRGSPYERGRDARVPQRRRHDRFGGSAMLQVALVFLLVALAAAALGFGGIAGTAAWVAKLGFFLFLSLFVVALIARGAQQAT